MVKKRAKKTTPAVRRALRSQIILQDQSPHGEQLSPEDVEAQEQSPQGEKPTVDDSGSYTGPGVAPRTSNGDLLFPPRTGPPVISVVPNVTVSSNKK